MRSTIFNINKDMQIIDTRRNNNVVGKLYFDEEGVHFKPSKLHLGSVRLPVRLSVEDQEEIAWIMREI